MKTFNVLVCGGRDYTDRAHVFSVLDAIHSYYQDQLLIIQGAARGVDLMAQDWAQMNEVPYLGVPARWKKLGKKVAGRERNVRMPTILEPNAVLSFPGGPGTAHMVEHMELNYPNAAQWVMFR